MMDEGAQILETRYRAAEGPQRDSKNCAKGAQRGGEGVERLSSAFLIGPPELHSAIV